MSSTEKHPKGTQAKILLTSVFGPYCRDDEYGSRQLNPMELYHNQVTRVQGPFSLRMFHRSWGIMFIQANISAPCNLLDFPTLDRFISELENQTYDVIGISSIFPNLSKVKKMCELIREHQPHAAIVIGGHVANKPDLKAHIDADVVVKGDGIRWFRSYLGEDETQPIRHPLILSGFGARAMGLPMSSSPKQTAATLVPSVGCPMGCNFCSTSWMFGGRGKWVNFYETGDELYDVMCQLEEKMKVRSFFVMDENFLFHKKRALRLLELMKQGSKAWSLYVFSSANVLRSYTMEQLVELGISWVWIGLEGEEAHYAKLKGADTKALVAELQEHGIRVLGSTIIGLEEHRPENMAKAIRYAVEHDTDFHQFMLYTPVPGTLLYEEQQEKKMLLPDGTLEQADMHGQLKFNFVHPHLREGQETEFLVNAFQMDFDQNGPSIFRIARTLFKGWLRYKDHPDLRIRSRFEWEARDLASTYVAGLWAGERWFRRSKNFELAQKIRETRKAIYDEFGIRSRALGAILGRISFQFLRREAKRLAKGWVCEPPTFYDTNYGYRARKRFKPNRKRGFSTWVMPRVVPSYTR
ncbi:MAG: cobalamin B12-binding domain-containing protein [Deltaproteobacteria bacterium]|nr:cobalamin B12-binding domain-containing protein [Deltaproteobacteria bacterium]